jgi:D-alanine-D-alanine ligase-like ATP-grasp enzyme
LGIRCFGNSTFNQLLSQDKFKTIVVCARLGVPTPVSLLADGTHLLVGSVDDRPAEMFVKPCSLDNKIGIFSDARTTEPTAALAVCERIKYLYGDRALIQEYVRGRDLRVSFLNVQTQAPPERSIGIYWSVECNDAEPPFTSYEAHLNAFLEWDAGNTLGAPQDVRRDAQKDAGLPPLLSAVTALTGRIAGALGLRDYYAIDFRVDHDGGIHLMEINTAPFLRNAGMRDFVTKAYGIPFGAGVAEALLNAFRRQPSE